MARLLQILALLLLLASQGLPAKSMQTSNSDIAYLRRFAAATGADQLLGWHARSDPCEDHWAGIACDNDGKVLMINLQDKGLLGTVPDIAESGSLSSLENLYIGGNAFTGTLPILPLPHLRYLRLDSNFFTTVPTGFFTRMPGLWGFNITNNTELVGWTLSEELRSLTFLRSFQASNAGINGTLQDFFTNTTAGFPFPNLGEVSMASNQISGTVPELKGSKIRILDLSKNLLSGSLDFISDLASSVEHLQLSHNTFTGPLPDFTEFASLALLSVDHNQITGVVPSSLTRLKMIIWVYLSGNLLQGPLPDFSTNVHTDVAKAAASGSFCRLDHGPCDPEVDSFLHIARAFGYPQRFAANWLRNDACDGWIGVHCDDRRRVTRINLSRLGLSGTMDSAFGSLRSLEAILLSGNNIVGEIPASVAQLPALRVLDVTNNNLVGTMPKFRDDVAVWIEGNPRLQLSVSSIAVPSTIGFFVTLVVALLPVFHV